MMNSNFWPVEIPISFFSLPVPVFFRWPFKADQVSKLCDTLSEELGSEIQAQRAEKNSVRNFKYGTRTQLIRGFYMESN